MKSGGKEAIPGAGLAERGRARGAALGASGMAREQVTAARAGRQHSVLSHPKCNRREDR